MQGWSGGPAGRRGPDLSAAADADLARAWASGDPGGFEEAYRRFGPSLFGTAVGLLGDRTAAADVVHDVFVRAAPRVGGLREPDRLRAWLFAILRNEAASHHRARRHDGGSLDDDAGGAMTARLADDATPADVEASRAELATLVWTAAEGLQDRDREVLELNVRGGLEGGDLADALGVTPGHAAVLLSRMRDRLERCLGALLVARSGRRDCDALDRLLDGWDGRFSLEVRSKVTRHVEGCPRCGQRRSALVSLEKLAPALLPPAAVLLPTDLRARLVASLGPDGVGASGPPTGGWGWRDDGFPEQVAEPVRRPGPVTTHLDAAVLGGAALLGTATGPDLTGPGRKARFVGAHRERRGRARPVAVLAALAVLLLGGGTAVVTGFFRSDPDSVRVRVVASSSAPAGSGRPTPSGPTPSGPSRSAAVTTSGRAPLTSTSTRGATSAAPTTPARSTSTSRTTTPAPSSSTPTRTTSPSPTRTTPSRTPTTTPAPTGPVIDRLSASPGTVFAVGNCLPLLSTVTVTFTAAAGATVTGTWSPDGDTTVQLVLTGRGSTRSGTVGPYRTARSPDTVSVTVTDRTGSVTRTVGVTVDLCVG